MKMLDILQQYAYPKHQDTGQIFNSWTQYSPGVVHIFTEGIKDEIFYREFIEKFYRRVKIKFWVCGTRSKVENLLAKIKDDSSSWTNKAIKYNRNKLLFILDRDFYFVSKIQDTFKSEEFLKEDTNDSYENVFVTDYHSAENYVSGKAGFEFIVREVFKIQDETEIEKLVIAFEKEYSNFIYISLYCFVWYKTLLPDSSKSIEKEIYKKSLFVDRDLKILIAPYLANGGILVFAEMSKILYQHLKPALQAKFDQKDKSKFEKRLNAKLAPLLKNDLEGQRMYIRGKDDLWFLIWFFLKIKRKLKNKFGLNESNAMYILTYKLRIPKKIKDFLELNSKEFENYIQSLQNSKGNNP